MGMLVTKTKLLNISLSASEDLRPHKTSVKLLSLMSGLGLRNKFNFKVKHI